MKSDYSIQQNNNDAWPQGHTSFAFVPYTRKPASLTIRKENNLGRHQGNPVPQQDESLMFLLRLI